MVLVVGLEFAGIGVQRNDRVGAEIVPGAYLPHKRPCVACSPIGEVELRVITSSDPDGYATGLPGVAGPALVACFAGSRDRKSFPQRLSCFRVKGLHEPAYAELAPRHTNHDFAAR